MIRPLLDAALRVLQLLGVFAACRRLKRPGVLILCYHGISAADEHAYLPWLFMRREVQLLVRYRPDLQSFVDFHLDPPLRALVDPSDVVQEAQLEVVRRIDDFLARRPMPFHLWLRKTAYQRLLNLRRDHRRARRSVEREEPWPARSSLLVARPLVPGGPSPSQHAQARERAERVGRAVAALAEDDREVLLMRHAQELPYEEIACLLDIQPAAARKRYGRALIRLQKVLADHGLLE
jgi:RNA polymerase sigma-70 factor (ECF subfamily)